MEQKRIKVRLTKNSPYSDYGYYEKGDIGYIDGYVNDNAVIILENGKFAKADLRWIEVVNEEDKNVNTELAESEDERIRKGLIKYFRAGKCENISSYHGISTDSIIAWLERQGEHDVYKESFNEGYKLGYREASENIAEEPEKYGLQKQGEQNLIKIPKFRVGDVVKSKSQPTLRPRKIKSIDKDGYRCEGCCFIGFAWEFDYELVEQKPEWSEEDETGWTNTMIMIKECASNHYTKDSIKLVIDWLESIKDRVLPKQELSEEDRDLIEELISYFRNEIAIGSLDSEHYKNYIIPKLILFRPQPHWKPTEEQMDALETAVSSLQSNTLELLYQDLKREKIYE